MSTRTSVRTSTWTMFLEDFSLCSTFLDTQTESQVNHRFTNCSQSLHLDFLAHFPPHQLLLLTVSVQMCHRSALCVCKQPRSLIIIFSCAVVHESLSISDVNVMASVWTSALMQHSVTHNPHWSSVSSSHTNVLTKDSVVFGLNAPSAVIDLRSVGVKHWPDIEIN